MNTSLRQCKSIGFEGPVQRIDTKILGFGPRARYRFHILVPALANDGVAWCLEPCCGGILAIDSKVLQHLMAVAGIIVSLYPKYPHLIVSGGIKCSGSVVNIIVC